MLIQQVNALSFISNAIINESKGNEEEIMRKRYILGLSFLLLLLTSCAAQKSKQTTKQNATVSVKTTTNHVLQAKSKTWVFTKKVVSQQTKKRGVASQLTTSMVSKTDTTTNWVTAKGQFMAGSVNYKKVSLKEWRKNLNHNFVKSGRKKIHLMSVDQVNAVLKKLGANFRIAHLTDLIFLATKSNGLTIAQAFAAKGHHLYAINIPYFDNNQTLTIDRGEVFTDTGTKKATGQISLAKLNGTWIAPQTTTSSTDTGKILIKDGYLYQQRFDSFERSAIQNLSTYSLISLNQNTTYANQKINAANAGYQLTQKTVASGDSLGYLYLFINQNKMIRIGAGVTTNYKKVNTLVAASDLPQDDITIFQQMDQKNPGEAASTITVKAGPAVVGMSKSIKYLTNPEAGQITSNQTISLNNGQVSVSQSEN